MRCARPTLGNVKESHHTQKNSGGKKSLVRHCVACLFVWSGPEKYMYLLSYTNEREKWNTTYEQTQDYNDKEALVADGDEDEEDAEVEADVEDESTITAVEAVEAEEVSVMPIAEDLTTLASFSSSLSCFSSSACSVSVSSVSRRGSCTVVDATDDLSRSGAS
jgi:hypothetical protein